MKQNVKCPYEESGLCYRKGCIYKPHLQCMTKREFDSIMQSAKHVLKKKKKGGKRYGC